MHLLLGAPCRSQRWFAARPSVRATVPFRTHARSFVEVQLPKQTLAGFQRARKGSEKWTNQALQGRLNATGTVITTDNVAQTTVQRFLGHVHPLPLRMSKGGDPAVILLLTPSYSASAYNRGILESFLRRLVGWSGLDAKSPFKVDMIVAVVDRLPSPDSFFARATNGSLSRPPKWQRGGGSFEGMAYSIAQELTFDVARDDSHAGRSGGIGDAGIASTLTLSVLDRHLSSDDESPSPDASQRISNSSFEIPLASTIFHTGRPQTMVQHKFRSGEGKLSLMYSQTLTRANAFYDFHDIAGSRTAQTTHLTADLLPLTLPQQIRAAMGNVVREVSDANDPVKTTPASQQLEASVSQYFATRSIPPHPAAVWALVIPEACYLRWRDQANLPAEHSFEDGHEQVLVNQLEDLRQVWQQKQSLWQDRIYQTLAAGGRLVKVLSGGGGWGKRIGLLSLDPELSFTKPDAEADPVATSGDPSFLTSADAARVGDYIQFFVFSGEGGGSLLDRAYTNYSGRFPAIEVGTVPSTIDDPPSAGADSDSNSSKVEMNVYRGFFGALSEAGIGLSLTGRDGQVHRTKVNVPWSRLMFNVTPRTSRARAKKGGKRARPVGPSLKTEKTLSETQIRSSSSDTLPIQSDNGASAMRTFYARPRMGKHPALGHSIRAPSVRIAVKARAKALREDTFEHTGSVYYANPRQTRLVRLVSGSQGTRFRPHRLRRVASSGASKYPNADLEKLVSSVSALLGGVEERK